MAYRIASILLGAFALGCFQTAPISSGPNSNDGEEASTQTATTDSLSDDTGSESADTTQDEFCQRMWTADCSKWTQNRKTPALAHLSDFGLADAAITDVSADLSIKEASYDIAVIGMENTDAGTRPFLLVFRSSDPTVYTISRTQPKNVERIFGLHRIAEKSAWRAITCDNTCRLVQSKATSLEDDDLRFVSGVDPVPSIAPQSLAASGDSLGSRPVLVGHDVVHLEEDGTWTTLIEGDDDEAFNAAYRPVTALDVLAVADGGKIVHYSTEGIDTVETGTTDDFVTGWARKYHLNAAQGHLQIYAMSAQGTALATDSQGNNVLCPTQIEAPVAIFDEGLGSPVQTVTANGERFVVYQKDGTVMRCPYLGFDGKITGAKNLYCGIATNLFAWNEKEVFAEKEAFCAID